MKKRLTAGIAQASLEYVTVYGWALAFIAIIMGTLFFVTCPAEQTTSCTHFDHFLVKGVYADNEKITLIVQNATAGPVNGFGAYYDLVYDSKDSPPLFQINEGDAVVGSTTMSVLSNDFVIDFIDGYKQPLGKGIEKEILIPWNIEGFSGLEFGADGCDFFSLSLGKRFNAKITAYYRDQFDIVRQETAVCSGTIKPALEIDFPPEVWGC